jgi:hypothetical protein
MLIPVTRVIGITASFRSLLGPYLRDVTDQDRDLFLALEGSRTAEKSISRSTSRDVTRLLTEKNM